MGTSRGRQAAGAVGGVVAAGAALSFGYLVAAVTGGPWPVDAVGVQIIDWSPGPVKDFAVRELGTADRPLLRAGICVVLALVAAAAGAIGAGGWGGNPRRLPPPNRSDGRDRRAQAVAVGIAAGLGVVGVVFAAFGRSAAAGVVDRLLPAIVTLVVAVLAMALVVRSPRPKTEAEQPEGFDRRRFLVTVAGLAVAGAAAWSTTRVASFGPGDAVRAKFRVPTPADAAGPLPVGVQADVPGVSRFVTPNAKFYRVDTLLQVPRIDPDDWELRIHGMVNQELRLSLGDLVERRLIERDITLTCVSNEVGGPYVSTARWIGIPIADILAEAGVRSGADAVKSTSIDGLTIGTPLSALTDGRDAIFAVAMNGEPLPFEHGFPVRMVVPGLYGYVSATKWIVDFEVTRFQDFSAYWTDRGWSVEAPVKTASRIDVPKGFATIKAGPAVAAGVAWAQQRGIRKVEVQVDSGPWQEATLAAEDTIDTWRQWTFRWDATPGNHKLTVRATDGDGDLQTAQRAAPRPNGSSGLHNTVVMVE
ncbi:molybdopterin-dependent oxidoreductase [Kribbella sp. NPDC050241]|uniref:molybdopterin-dependent oxidoreductase n=1 Tax=Kribbella sp. NPDC050241 TaxID=3364115 RepID=UPI003788151B